MKKLALLSVIALLVLAGCAEEPTNEPVDTTIIVFDVDGNLVLGAEVEVEQNGDRIAKGVAHNGSITLPLPDNTNLNIIASSEECEADEFEIYAGEFQEYNIKLPCETCVPGFKLTLEGTPERPLMEMETCFAWMSDSWWTFKSAPEITVDGQKGYSQDIWRSEDWARARRNAYYNDFNWGAPTTRELWIRSCPKTLDEITIQCMHHKGIYNVTDLYQMALLNQSLALNDTRAPEALKISVRIDSKGGESFDGVEIHAMTPDGDYLYYWGKEEYTDVYDSDETDDEGVANLVLAEGTEFRVKANDDNRGIDTITDEIYTVNSALVNSGIKIALETNYGEPGEVAFRVYTDTGIPMENVTVTVIEKRYSNITQQFIQSLEPPLVYNTTTDEKGLAILVVENEDGGYVVNLIPPDQNYETAEIKFNPEGMPRRDLDIYLKPLQTFTMTFHVTDENTGMPIANATIGKLGWLKTQKIYTDGAGLAYFKMEPTDYALFSIIHDGYYYKSIQVNYASTNLRLEAALKKEEPEPEMLIV